MNCLFIFKSYKFLIYLAYIYLWSILQNATEIWPGFIYRKFKINKGQNEAKETCNTGVVVCGIPHVVTETVQNNYFLSVLRISTLHPQGKILMNL